MATRTSVKGLEELKAKLERIPQKTRDLMRLSLAKGADDITSMMRRLVPVRTGELRKSIGWRWGNIKGVSQGGDRDLTLTIYAGSDKAFYARWIEFGTVKMNAQAYFFPSYRALRASVKKDLRAAAKVAATWETLGSGEKVAA